ncbi:MAG: LPS export ABC transporter permease LptG [Hyphomicrobiaceae bacterium]
MPNALKRYIAAKFLIMILGTFLLCALLIFMIDFIEMLRQSGKAVSAAGARTTSVPMSRVVFLTLLRLPAYSEILLMFAVLVGSIGALLTLSRKSELAVMRAAGMSVWQFTWPGIVVAFALGVLAVTVYNPLAAGARSEAERLFAETYGRESDFLSRQSGGNWLRQDGADGPSVLTAGAVTDRGLTLTAVTVFLYTRSGSFVERIDAARARLNEGYWELTDGWSTRVGTPPRKFSTHHVSTHLTPERVLDALGSVISLSFWELPGLIEVIEKAGLSAAPYRVQHELLLARPMLLVAMVLLAATVSLRSFRGGGIQTMVITGMIGGFSFFLMAEISRQLGVAGLVSPGMAVWVPVLVLCLVSGTILLHQEDG